MTAYSFQEGIPNGFEFDFDSGIFHDPKHLHLQAVSGWHTYVMLKKAERLIVALLHVHIENEVAISPLRSPYGSILISKSLSYDSVSQFIDFVEGKLKEHRVKKTVFKNPPEIYLPGESEYLKKALTAVGYECHADTSAVISVSNESFESRLHYSEQKRLRKCKEAKFIFKQLEWQNLPVVYQFLKTCREQKGYVLSMSFDELTKVIEVFPDVFLLTAVMDNERLVAANISIQVNSTVLYNFYHDHEASYDGFSPVVFLNEGLYRLCQQRNLKLLDLGTSQIDGKLNESLLNFKLKLGAQPSHKFTFVKNLS